MNKTEQAQQLRLAVDIFETGHPFEVRHDTSERWHPSLGINPTRAVLDDWHLHPILATPPDGRPLHNPDSLTAEQVGLGYRLALPGDNCNQPFDFWSTSQQSWEAGSPRDGTFESHASTAFTYRLPLSVPWPEAKPAVTNTFKDALRADPYAEFKAAHAAGKVIQMRDNVLWNDLLKEPHWESIPLHDLRIKPWTLPPPPPGMKWHREDGWKQGDLPQGYRPLVDGEEIQSGDEIKWAMDCDWKAMDGLVHSQANKHGEPKRTARPLVFTHEGKQWTWHRAGDPMPCDGGALIEAVYGEHKDSRKAADYNWDARTSVFGWHYDEVTKQVELGPEDVPPGSVFSFKTGVWVAPLRVSADGVGFPETEAGKPLIQKWSFALLAETAEINRSIPLTGKWDATAWEPCHKPKPLANG
jgi:hypothetical protein